MDQVAYYHRLPAFPNVWGHPEHLQPTYWLACYDGHSPVVFWLVQVDGNDPGRIQWLCPIKTLNKRSLKEVLDDRTFKWVCCPDTEFHP